MNMPQAGVDPLFLLPGAMLLPLAATLRQSWPGAARCRGVLAGVIAGAGWLLPLIFIVPACVGLMVTGALSPLPQIAYADMSGSHGRAMGLAAAVAVVIADLWLLLTPAMVLLRHAPEAQAAHLRAAVPLNVALGGLFLTAVLVLRG
ncbi:hypothetical protein J3E64_001990 [Sphingobium sp. OAS761]|uniref:hypothetical protein n=1 Tax=Sphingobium sp. OAS761 TaxID=2817901 RepID=UPI00209DA79E|nr:hypothetical protein [Sphingobium sp. OAS761]MCP1470302.1 hypothetical protein [Sphingobium sp. OAS761]